MERKYPRLLLAYADLQVNPTLTTPAPTRRRGGKYDMYKYPELVLTMDLKSWGLLKLRKVRAAFQC
eukprot:4712707-Pleurochrysis_carterae.AAC.2